MFLKLLKDPIRLMFFLVGFAAIGLYIFYFGVNREFWLDEAFLGINILNKSYFELWLPLDYKQVAPPLFLMLAKFIYQLPTGLSVEQSTRLYPLLCGIGSVFLFPMVARNFIKSKLIVLITFILFCFNFRIIYYVQEFKQYGPDVFWGLFLTLFFLKIKIESIKNFRLFFYGLLFGCLLFLSHTSIFFVAAGFATLFFDKCVVLKPFKINKSVFWKMFCMGIGYFIPLVLILFLDYFNPYHDFMYLSWKSMRGFLKKDFFNFFEIFYSYLDYLLLWGKEQIPIFVRIILYVLLSILLLVLLFCFTKQNFKNLWYIFFLTFGVLIASYLDLYPMADRSLLYFFPLFIIIIGAGADLRIKMIRALSSFYLLLWLFETGDISATMTQQYQYVPMDAVRESIKELKKENNSDIVPIYISYGILFPNVPDVPDHSAVFIFYKQHLNYFPKSEVHYDSTVERGMKFSKCEDYFSPNLVSGKKYALIWEKGFGEAIYGWQKILPICIVQFGRQARFKKKGHNLYFWTQP